MEEKMGSLRFDMRKVCGWVGLALLVVGYLGLINTPGDEVPMSLPGHELFITVVLIWLMLITVNRIFMILGWYTPLNIINLAIFVWLVSFVGNSAADNGLSAYDLRFYFSFLITPVQPVIDLLDFAEFMQHTFWQKLSA
jgi:hypothetical protein